MTEFETRRRQQFLSERHYNSAITELTESIEYFSVHSYGSGRDDGERSVLARMSAANDGLRKLIISYTAGQSIDILRQELEVVVSSYERYGRFLWEYHKDRSEVVFDFTSLDDYCQLMQVIGLCFLLHRRDLLLRLAALQDGEDGANGGCDVIYEEFMIHVFGAEKRYETDHACQVRPYENLFYALTEDSPDKQLKELDLFLKHWYKDLAGTGWHDSHKPDENGNQGGYYGYWSFEAGAAVLLLGIEDDSRLHKYIYYPKDLVAWARQNASLNQKSDSNEGEPLTCHADEPCPREGFWFTPATPESRRHFKLGDIMPSVASDYGLTIWQWDARQG